jgi:glutamate-5-semialdehyde dehydrogenase
MGELMDIREFVTQKAIEAKAGARSLAKTSSEHKNRVLIRMAEALKERSADLIAENKKDIEFAEKKGLSKALIDRLAITEKRVKEMAYGLEEVARLPDPVGRCQSVLSASSMNPAQM